MERGYIIYEGPSELDGSPIAVILTMESRNTKTGNMAQTWIIRADQHPMGALQNGADASVCGDCKHRPILGGACYVNVGQAPSQVYAAYKRGSYPRITPKQAAALLRKRTVRIGAYGDGAAAPAHIWHELVSDCLGWTGYTHQWRKSAELQGLCMASVDDVEEYREAKLTGWRTFRVRTAQETLQAREIMCPAADEGGNLTQCTKCKLCNGTASRGKDIAIVVHGAKAKRFIMMKAA